jgi:hypothetical protein
MHRIILLAALAASVLLLSGGSLGKTQRAVAATPDVGQVSQVPLATIGQPKAIIDPSGIKLSVVVNDFRTPRRSEVEPPPGGGRWVLLDVSVTNVGTIPYVLDPAYFILVSPDSTIYHPDGAMNLPYVQMPDVLLAPGETVNGTIVYAIPSGAQLQLVEFQAPGMAQWVIALLPS